MEIKNLLIKIKEGPLEDKIRAAARKEGWAGGLGLKEWAKETYNARLHIGHNGYMTSIKFKTEQDCIMFSLKFGVC